MDQIYIKTANPKCLLLTMDQKRYLAAGVYIPYPPYPPPPMLHTVHMNTLYLFTKRRGGGGLGEPVRRLEGR